MPRRKQQLGGLILALVGAGFTAWGWYTALYRGYFSPKASVLFPALFIVGLGIIIFPGYREERLARGEDISRLQGWRLITARWWTILAVALAVGGTNFILLKFL